MENSQKRPRVETVFLGKAPAAEKPFSCVKINGNKNWYFISKRITNWIPFRSWKL